jgi:lipid II:glycine glycyltransferase (peptidoglycan interpeptide bridge formation enzyme)
MIGSLADAPPSTAIRLCRTPGDFVAWDAFVGRVPGAHFLQLHGWLSSYEPMGARCGVLVQLEGGRIVAGCAFLSIRVPVLGRPIFIVPHGPVCESTDDGSWTGVMEALEAHVRRSGALYVQLWPHVARDDEAGLQPYLEAGYDGPRLFTAHEFGSTLLAVDLAGRTEEQLLAAFRRKTRYQCRRSLASGLELRLGTGHQDLRSSYALWAEAGRHHGFQLRPYAAFEIAFDRLVPKEQALLVQAWRGDAMAGSMLVVLAGRTASYLAGGVRRAFAALFPGEFMHLAAMRLARARGAATYDLVNWSTSGVAQFKRGFRPRECVWAEPRTKIYHSILARSVSWTERTFRPLVRRHARALAR